jgi:hypothetical protein
MKGVLAGSLWVWAKRTNILLYAPNCQSTTRLPYAQGAHKARSYIRIVNHIPERVSLLVGGLTGGAKTANILALL